MARSVLRQNGLRHAEERATSQWIPRRTRPHSTHLDHSSRPPLKASQMADESPAGCRTQVIAHVPRIADGARAYTASPCRALRSRETCLPPQWAAVARRPPMSALTLFESARPRPHRASATAALLARRLAGINSAAGSPATSSQPAREGATRISPRHCPTNSRTAFARNAAYTQL
jgi:hypothetical protein